VSPTARQSQVYLAPPLAAGERVVAMTEKADRDYTPYQQRIIRRYYDNQPALLHQRLAELVGDLYLAEGKQRANLWKRVAEAMTKLGVPPARVDHVVKQDKPALVAEVVKELERK
jgi:hypothetical protein